MVEERATEFPSERVDAAYIAHAANSYPKLVEALRVLYKSVHDTPQIACEYDPVPNHAAGALLRELGEDV